MDVRIRNSREMAGFWECLWPPVGAIKADIPSASLPLSVFSAFQNTLMSHNLPLLRGRPDRASLIQSGRKSVAGVAEFRPWPGAQKLVRYLRFLRIELSVGGMPAIPAAPRNSINYPPLGSNQPILIMAAHRCS